MKKPESICIFGDSTAWGAWDMEKGGWVSRLWFHIAPTYSEHGTEIYNLSVSGGTTNTILARFESEAKIRNAEAIIFQTGGNDATYIDGDPQKLIVSQDKFRSNITEIIKRAKKITNNIIFFDLKNCDESKTMPVSWGDYFTANENIQKYSKIMQEVCMENKVLFCDIPHLENDEFTDGLHPNAIGHEKIFQTVKTALEEKGWI